MFGVIARLNCNFSFKRPTEIFTVARRPDPSPQSFTVIGVRRRGFFLFSPGVSFRFSSKISVFFPPLSSLPPRR